MGSSVVSRPRNVSLVLMPPILFPRFLLRFGCPDTFPIVGRVLVNELKKLGSFVLIGGGLVDDTKSSEMP